MARFSKSAMLECLLARIQYRRDRDAFDPRNGTAQLWPKGATERDKQLIDRAVAYGELKALERVLEDVSEGRIP